MRRQATKLSLQIRHPDRDLSVVCETLGRRPNVIWKKGEERRTPKGRRLRGTQERSYCTIDLGPASRTALSKKIATALAWLTPHRALLRRLVATGGRVSFYVGWFCDEHTGEAFEADLLAAMADLRIALDLNLYIPDDPAN